MDRACTSPPVMALTVGFSSRLLWVAVHSSGGPAGSHSLQENSVLPAIDRTLRSEIRPLACILTATRIGAAQSSSPALHSRSNTARFSLSNT